MNLIAIRRAVALCYFLQGIIFATWASRIPDIKTSLGLSDGDFGRVLFAMPVGQLVCLQISGMLVARLGSHRLLPVAMPLYALLLIAVASATSPLALAACLFAFGAIGNVSSISVNTQGILAERQFERPIMASFHGIWSLSGFAGGMLGLAMVHAARTPFAHYTTVALVVALVTQVLRRYLVPSSPLKQQPTLRGRFRDPLLLQLGCIGFCNLATEGAMFDWSGVYFKEVVHAPASLVVVGYSSFMAMMAAGRFVADRMLVRVGRKRLLQGSGLLTSAGLLGAVLFPTLAPCTLAFMLVGLGVSSVIPNVYSLAGKSDVADPGEALATVSGISFLGFLMGPPLIGTLATYFTLRGSFAVIACFGLVIPALVSRHRLLEQGVARTAAVGDPHSA